MLHRLHLVSEMPATVSLILFTSRALFCNGLDYNLIVGSWAKKILVVVSKKYSVELRAAVQKFMEVCGPTL